MKKIFLHLIAGLCLFASTAIAQDDDSPKRAYLDAASAGTKFKLQGEYTGDIQVEGNTVKLGVQVIAGEKNKLKFAAYVGGLPGDGWTGNDALRGEGEISGSKATLVGENGSGEIVDGELTIFNRDKNAVGKLKKVERKSPTEGAKPPAGAVILFDGSTADNFENGKLTEDKLLQVGVTSKQEFQDFELHLEFRLAFMPNANGQARSNSGCYLQGRYEVQILDSFGLKGLDNECGGIYQASKPDINMCFPPLSWQTYDIEFHAAKFDSAGKKTSNAKVTVKHNGVVIHRNRELPAATPGGPLSKEGAEPGPLFLQNHGDPLRFRNIWVKPL
jgi:hypothetical protein